MSYFIFSKESDNIDNTLFKIAENKSDLDNLLIDKSSYKIIEVDQTIFNDVKLKKKEVVKYNQNSITYSDITYSSNEFYFVKSSLDEYISNFKKNIKVFLDNNKNHVLFDKWNNYYTQLNSLNTNTITYPLEKSLEKYFFDLGQPSLNPLQIP